MGHKKKGRAAKNAKAKSAQEPEEIFRAPHTFVIKRGTVGKSVTNLMMDMRKVMEPYTASQLKVGKHNVLKDFIAVAGPLHVSHMISFSRSDACPNMRIMRLPRGPTLTFRIENFSLMRDVVSSLKKPQNHPKQYDHPPLLILNNFKGDQVESRLTTTMLQSMFPSLNVTKIKLNQVRRCVLFNCDPETGKVEFRHYNVKATPYGMSKAVKKIIRGKIPDMSRHQDISDFFAQGDVLSESEAEDNDPDNKIALPQAISSRGNMANQTSAIRLTELGPRMNLELIKIEEEICSGEILYHKYIHKTDEEIKDLRRDRILRQTRKNDARTQQERNVARKQQGLNEHKERCDRGIKRKYDDTVKNDDDIDEDGYRDEAMASDDDDEAWYEEEVGEKPEYGTMGSRNFGSGRGGRFRGGGNRRERGRFPRSRGGFDSRRSDDRGHNRSFSGRGRAGGGMRGNRDGKGRDSSSRGGFGRGRGSSSGRGDFGSQFRPHQKAVAFRKKSSFNR